MANEQCVFIVHRIPGRVRMIVEPLRGDPARAERVAGLARGGRWVLGAHADPVTASLIVEHDPEVQLRDVLAVLAEIPELGDCAARSLEELSRPRHTASAPADPTRTAGLVLRAVERVNSASTAVATPHADLKLLVPGALITYGVWRALSGRASPLPSWMILFKYGFDTFTVLNQGVIRTFIKERLARAGAPPAAGTDS